MSLALEIGLFFIAHQEGAGRAPHTTQRRAPSARRTLGVRQVHARPFIYLFLYIILYIYYILYIKYISDGQYYLFTVIATSKIGSSPIGCEDFRSLIAFSSKCFY